MTHRVMCRVLSCVCLLVLVVALLQVVEARSNGLLSSSGCDLSPYTDARKNIWPNGFFGRNKTSWGLAGQTIANMDSQVMRWVDAPVASNFYTIRSGDSGSRSSDPTQYIPGQYSEIHIRVSDLKRRFIGIVLYATNVTKPAFGFNTEKRVGEWKIPVGAPYQVPVETCGKSVVTHTDANLKMLHTRLFFRAPAGTGTVKFRVLLKQGEQNKGSFFWPVQELSLTEGAAPIVPTIPAGLNTTILPLNGGDGIKPYVIGTQGRACADVCNIQTPMTPYCHAQAIKDIRDLSSLKAGVFGQTACRLPMLAQCEFAGAPTINAEGFCSYRSNDIAKACPPIYATLNMTVAAKYEPDVCYTAPLQTSQAICVCTNNKSYKGVNPYAGQLDPDDVVSPTGSATSVQASMIIALIATVMALFAANQ